MTAAEIINIAFTRPINPDLIKQVDIDAARKRYVDYYVTDADDDFYAYSETENVIAYGVAFDLFERIDKDLSDRGVVKLSIQGVAPVQGDEKRALKRDIYKRLLIAMETMIDKADDEGYTIDNEDEIYPAVVTDRTNTMTL